MNHLKVLNNRDLKAVEDDKYLLKLDVLLGLSKPRKEIPPKYLYDSLGSEIFNEITRLPEYYLTQCEISILELYKNKLTEIIAGKSFNLIELGPGEGIKTEILIENFTNHHLNFTYIPIDISISYIKKLVAYFEDTRPTLELNALIADYIDGLRWISVNSNQTNLVLFLGSSIGNFSAAETKLFLYNLWNNLHHGDYLLIGFDLCKDIDMLMAAYADSKGVTSEFNFNVLKRINKELGADFDISKFSHYATYNVTSQAMESYMMSQEEQTIHIPELGQNFYFKPWEGIFVESSAKFLLDDIEQLAINTGFLVEENFLDEQQYFVDSLWRVNKP